jgi:hypothetical protein
MIDIITKKAFKNSLLLKCIIASLILHMGVIYFFYKNPITIYAATFFNKTKPNPTRISSSNAITEDQDLMLADVFENITVVPSAQIEPYDLVSIQPQTVAMPQPEDLLNMVEEETDIETLKLSISTPTPFSEKSLENSIEEIDIVFREPSLKKSPFFLTENLKDILEDSFSYSLELVPPVAVIDSIKAENNVAQEDMLRSVSIDPRLEKNKKIDDFFINHEDLANLKTTSEPVRLPTHTGQWGEREIQKDIDVSSAGELSKNDLAISYSQPGIVSPEESMLLEVVNLESWNDDFDVSVTLSPSKASDGYLFSISLLPKQSLALEKISQNFYFLIDASSATDKHKFSLFKRAVVKSLSSLQEGDTFNIIILDKKLTRLSQNNMIFNLKTLHLAEEFLESVSQSNYLSSANYIDSLTKIAGQISDDQQMHTALLLSNGHMSHNFKNQQKALTSFLEKNNHKLTIFAAAVGTKNNLANLDMLCNLTGGKVLYSDTNASFPRKFSQLVKSLRTPIAKDLKISMLTENAKASISLSTHSQQPPALFAGQPYVIMGKIDRLCDIHLCIEARHEQDWITLSKKISFDQAQLDPKLLTGWSKAQTGQHYNDFLSDAKSSHLLKAKEILQESFGKAALE